MRSGVLVPQFSRQTAETAEERPPRPDKRALLRQLSRGLTNAPISGGKGARGQHFGMPTKERLAAIGTTRGRWLIRQFADELRAARLAAGLSQGMVASAVGLSQRTISRYEAGEPPHPDLLQAARVAAIVGLELRLQAFPLGSQLRDAGHVALITRFLARLPATVGRFLEAPIGRGDPRAWDVLLTVGGTRIGVIAETRIRDLQALLRREHRKQLDGDVRLLLLLVADTRHNRTALAEAAGILAESFPLGTRATLASLSRGEAPTGNAIVIL